MNTNSTSSIPPVLTNYSLEPSNTPGETKLRFKHINRLPGERPWTSNLAHIILSFRQIQPDQLSKLNRVQVETFQANYEKINDIIEARNASLKSRIIESTKRFFGKETKPLTHLNQAFSDYFNQLAQGKIEFDYEFVASYTHLFDKDKRRQMAVYLNASSAEIPADQLNAFIKIVIQRTGPDTPHDAFLDFWDHLSDGVKQKVIAHPEYQSLPVDYRNKLQSR